MIEIKKIKELIKLMVTNDLTELDLEGDGERVRLKRGIGEPNVHYVTSPANPVSSANGQYGLDTGNTDVDANGNGQRDDGIESDRETIASPMVGTFYSAPTPDAKTFISVGDRVDPDKVVCIIEAMKVFNEIKAEVSGTVEKILGENGQAVEFGQPLFIIKPD